MNIHFIGIGGIGLSALARFLKAQGFRVSGSDIASTLITKALINEGVDVEITHKKENIKDNLNLIIYSAVVKKDNVELLEAKRRNIQTLSRSEALNFILKDKKVYSICGAHGKSTTTAILSSIMSESSAIIGAESKEFKSNMRYFNNNCVVFEADESDGSFLNSNPYCSIVTNAEPEHMEYYNYDLRKFYSFYEEFLNKATLKVINAEDEFLKTLQIEAIKLYPSQDITNISYILINDEPYTKFNLKDLGEFCVWGIGEHIALNASLAILSAMQSLELEKIRQNITHYKGIKKRFDILKKEKNFILIDDYGHHPTEIKATLNSVKVYAKLKKIDKIITIWQPHKYSRTVDNLQSFIECFEGSSEVIILPVWAAGEEPKEIDFKTLFNRYYLTFADNLKVNENKVFLLKDEKVIKELKNGIIIGFGAGDITYQLRN